MSDTLETISNNMNSKIQCLNKMLRILEENGLKYPAEHIDRLLDNILEYRLGAIDIIDSYLCAASVGASQEMKHQFNRYSRFLSEHNFIAFFNEYVEYFKKFLNLPNIKEQLEVEINKYMDTAVKCQINDVISSDKTCPGCNIKLTYLQNTNELICETCGFTRDIPGLSSEEESASYESRKKSKRGSYDPTKHCDFWLERIQARESIEIPTAVFDRIKQCCAMDNVRLHRLTCAQIREYLHQTKLTQFNNHVPYIRKIITGVAPPQLKESELQLIRTYFDKVDRIFEEIKPVEKVNCPYYPYFLYKIIDQILVAPSDSRRKIELLSCIHLQSRDTLITNDRLWDAICHRIPEFEYVPTDRNDQLTEF